MTPATSTRKRTPLTKSAALKAAAKKHGAKVRVVKPRRANPADRKGIPFIEAEPIMDYRPLDLGENTPHGAVAECVCGVRGAARTPKFWPQAQFFVHTLHRVAGAADLIRTSKDTFIHDGKSGQIRARDFHIVVDGKIIERDRETNRMGQGSRVTGELRKPSEGTRGSQRQSAAKSTSKSEQKSTAKASASLPPRSSGANNTASSSSQKRKTSEGARGARETSAEGLKPSLVNTDPAFRCINHATCGSKTRKHAKNKCYACYCAERKAARKA